MRIQFDYTGSSQTYTVPSGVTSIYIDISGASGGNLDPAADGADPGLGGHVDLILTVTAGDVLTIDVGGQGTDATVGSTAAGGWNGGGTGGRAAAAGGGCTAVYLNAVLVAVAGGGAGGGANSPTGTGGDGGADNGADGHVGALLGVNSGGKGGTPSAGGTGGAATGSGAVNGTSGSSLQGGTGATGAGDRGGGGGGGGGVGGAVGEVSDLGNDGALVVSEGELVVDGGKAQTLALFHLGFSRPGQEGDNVMGLLVHGRLGAILVAHLPVAGAGGRAVARGCWRPRLLRDQG